MQRVLGIGNDIRNLDRSPLDHGATGDRAAIDGERMIREELDIGLRIADRGPRAVLIAHAAHDESHVGIAEQRGGVDEGIEHRLQVEGRAADGLQHIADRGLLLQRFAQLLGARRHLVEQPRVLDRDHRLVGESAQQIGMVFGPGARLLARDADHSEHGAFAHQRCQQHRAIASQTRDVAQHRRHAGVGLGILDAAHAAVAYHREGREVGNRAREHRGQRRVGLRVGRCEGHQMQHPADEPEYGG